MQRCIKTRSAAVERTLDALRVLADENGMVRDRRQDEIADMVGACYAHVNRAIAWLERNGAIKVIRERGRLVTYVVVEGR